MNAQEMYEAGKINKKEGLTDKELADQIEAIDLAMNYLVGRGDCNLVVGALAVDKYAFTSYQNAREDSARRKQKA